MNNDRRKTMKKFIALVVLVIMCFTLVACNNSEKGDGSTQVQQITYTNGEASITLTSRFYFDYTIERVEAAEYEDAAEKLGSKYYTAGIIEVNGTVKNQDFYYFNNGETPEQLSEYIGKTYYYTDEYGRYEKITYTAIHISYLNITFVNDDTFEVSYYDHTLKGTQTLRIKTDNYKVVYFSTAE